MILAKKTVAYNLTLMANRKYFKSLMKRKSNKIKRNSMMSRRTVVHLGIIRTILRNSAQLKRKRMRRIHSRGKGEQKKSNLNRNMSASCQRLSRDLVLPIALKHKILIDLAKH